MKDARNGKWTWSLDEEQWPVEGFYDTQGEAFDAAVLDSEAEEDQTIYLGVVDNPDPCLSIEADRLLEDIFERDEMLCCEWHERRYGETPAQVSDLELRLRRAFDDWLSVHGLQLKGCTIDCKAERSMPDSMEQPTSDL